MPSLPALAALTLPLLASPDPVVEALCSEAETTHQACLELACGQATAGKAEMMSAVRQAAGCLEAEGDVQRAAGVWTAVATHGDPAQRSEAYRRLADLQQFASTALQVKGFQCGVLAACPERVGVMLQGCRYAWFDGGSSGGTQYDSMNVAWQVRDALPFSLTDGGPVVRVDLGTLETSSCRYQCLPLAEAGAEHFQACMDSCQGLILERSCMLAHVDACTGRLGVVCTERAGQDGKSKTSIEELQVPPVAAP